MIDAQTVDLGLTFDEAVTDLTLADFSTPTGSACTIALPTVGTDSARIRLTCSPGPAVVRLAASAVTDSAGNPGPTTHHDTTTITFTATPTPVIDTAPTVEPTPALRPFVSQVNVVGTSSDVSVALSRRRFETDSGPVVYVALADRPVDVAAAGAAAVARGGPLLLVGAATVPTATIEEIRRLGATRVVVVGGGDAIGDEVIDALRGVVGDGVVRLSGSDRYATAVAVSRATFAGGTDTVYVVSGRSAIDALGVARFGRPVLLTDSREVPAVTARELDRLRPNRIVVVGGNSVIDARTVELLARAARIEATAVDRWAGPDRAATTATVATADRTSLRTVIIVNGHVPAGGLAAATLLADPDTAVLLSGSMCLPAATRAILERWRPSTVLVVGNDPRLVATIDQYRSC